jgi:hypothetical protein
MRATEGRKKKKEEEEKEEEAIEFADSRLLPPLPSQSFQQTSGK